MNSRTFEFVATIGKGSALQMPTKGQNDVIPTGGAVKLELLTGKPEAPKPAYWLGEWMRKGNAVPRNQDEIIASMKTRDYSGVEHPGDEPTKRKNEADEAYQNRYRQWEDNTRRWLQAIAKRTEECETYYAQLAALSPDLMTYAQLAGALAILGGEQVKVTMELLDSGVRRPGGMGSQQIDLFSLLPGQALQLPAGDAIPEPASVGE